jgi:hypothetical protein
MAVVVGLSKFTGDYHPQLPTALAGGHLKTFVTLAWTKSTAPTSAIYTALSPSSLFRMMSGTKRVR